MDTYTKPALSQRQNIFKDLVVFIRNKILSGELNPGDRIVETHLASELGISQTPVREALRQLQGEGIVTVVPNKGPMVRSLDPDDLFDIYSVRSMLEGLAIRLAVQHATDEELAQLKQAYNRFKDGLADEKGSFMPGDSYRIHEQIVKLSRHSRVISMYESTSVLVAIANRRLGANRSIRAEIERHEELLDALQQRDPDHAERTMRKHIYDAYRELIERIGANDLPAREEKSWF
jgi:DNA-binding GntR family transcriptional regulator